MFFSQGSKKKVRKLVLHIGMHKTGSTAIQASMSSSSKYLLSKGINYLSGIRMNHSTTFLSLFGDEPHKHHFNVQDGINTPDKVRKHNQYLKKIVLEEIEKNNSEIFVISGEGLSLLPEFGVEKLREFLSPHFDKIQVVCYVRRPLEFYKSMCQQYIVGWKTKEQLRINPPFPDYKFRLDKYVNAFGRDSLTVKVFDRQSLSEGDVVFDFLTHLGVSSKDIDKVDRVETNESLSKTAIDIIDSMNGRLPVFVDNEYNSARAPFIRRAFVQATRKSGDEAFWMPCFYDASHVSIINKDVDYVNDLLPESDWIDKINVDDCSTGDDRLENDITNKEFVAELVNELQMTAERRLVRIKNLEKKLRDLGN